MLRRFVAGLTGSAGSRLRDRALTEAARLRDAGELGAAAHAAEEVARRNPDDPEARLLLADIRRERGEFGAAERIAREVIGAHPEHLDACMLLGSVLREAGNLHSAAKAYVRAMSIAPDDLRPRIEMATMLIRLDQANEAATLLQYVLNRDPESAEANGNMGIALQRLANPAGALPYFEKAAALDAGNVLHCNNLALAKREMGSLDEAAQLLRAAYARSPDDPTTINNLASVLADTGDAQESRALVEPLVARRPRFLEARCTLARVLQDLGELDAARSHLETALAQQPTNADVRTMLAFHLLARGDFGRGWDEYEARVGTADTPRRNFPFPEWRSESFAGKSVLIYAEQGIGDEIMFANCFDDVIAEAGRVVIEADPRLARLFARSFPGAEVFPGRLGGPHPWLEAAGAIDVQLPAGELPRRYRRSWAGFPQHRGYLKPDPARIAHYRQRLASLGPGRKFGFAWRGGLAKTRRALRSIEPDALRPLLGREALQFVSLQHNVPAPDLAAFGGYAAGRFHHWPEALQDADETAALASALDGIVTVCNYIVHLGGALGLDVRVMAPASPEWRYLREGDAMPWYPSVRLYRKGLDEDWSRVVDAVAASL